MADASKKKIIDLRKIFDDEEYNLAAENQGWYCQQLQCENLQGAWDTLGGYSIKALANGAQNLQAGYWFLAQIVPKVTGYSMFVLPDNAFKSYQIPLFDNTYPQNPKSLPEGGWKAAISGGGKFEGFKNYGWTCEKNVTDQETLLTSKQQVQCNDNTIIYNIMTYDQAKTDPKTKASLGTAKFDFACNQYKANRADFKGNQVWVSGIGNNENIMIFRHPSAIIGFNWPTLEYKGPGNRTPVGSVAKGISDCIGFINELIEREMLDGEKW